MSKGIGRLIQFGIAKEAVRGTVEAAASYWIPVDELELDEKDERVSIDQSRGVIEPTIGEEIVKQYAQGSIKAPIGDKHFPLILYSVCGTIASGSAVDSAYGHLITVAQSAQHQALSLFIDDPQRQCLVLR